eukprot:2557523-Rhodomonas_salina.1
MPGTDLAVLCSIARHLPQGGACYMISNAGFTRRALTHQGDTMHCTRPTPLHRTCSALSTDRARAGSRAEADAVKSEQQRASEAMGDEILAQVPCPTYRS